MLEEEIVYLLWNDLVGLSRTRGVPSREFPGRREHGLGWALAGQALTPFEDIADNPWGPMDEVRQTPDLDTETRVDCGPDAGPLHFVICDSLLVDGRPWECCTRSFLKQALADLYEHTGLTLKTSFESEFTLSGEAVEWAAPFSLDAARSQAPLLRQVTAALLQARVGLETVEPEFGVNQYEVSCAPASGLAGADRGLITREVVREVARRAGLRASFSPKTSPQAVGNGCHIHLSLWDGEGRPATYDPATAGELSEVAGQFVAGIVRHLPALVAFTAPSPVSYLRLGPHHWSCGFDAVGVQNREAAVRICPSPVREAARRGPAFNLEFRPTDATASPYLAIGALVRAGLEGIRDRLPPPALLDRDPADLDAAERAARGLRALPETLEVALAALEADAVVSGWFTPVMQQAYLAVKRKELAMFAGAEPAELCRRYALAY